jgi:hypothetical protein
MGLQLIASLSRERFDVTVPAPFGSTTTFSSAFCRGGMMLGSSSSSLNFAPTTSSPESSNVHIGDVPASWQAPLHLSNSAAGAAVSETSAKAAN